MKVWTNVEFEGHWPVGTAAVVVADTAAQATALLNKALKSVGLSESAEEKQFKSLPTHSPLVALLRDGDY